MPDDQAKQGLFYPGQRPAAEPAGPGARGVPAQEPERKGIPRRMVFRWLGWGTILALLGQWTAGVALGFFWPKKVGAFGGVVSAGSVDELEVGEVQVVQAGKFYLSRVPEGVMALWWKCPHLGCTVPWKPNDPSEDPIRDQGRFNCPCHGSIYDRYGQIITGPAPRPMDLFPVEIQDGRIMVNTNPNTVVQRDRAEHGPPHVTPV